VQIDTPNLLHAALAHEAPQGTDVRGSARMYWRLEELNDHALCTGHWVGKQAIM
jgi:hypothetical protein